MDDAAGPDPSGMTCSDGWRITGYYLPAEEDFAGELQQIEIEGAGADSFRSDFLSATRMEGWARTRYGWFLGRGAGKWIKAAEPQNAQGKPLHTGSLAVDRATIPLGTGVRLPNAPLPWNAQAFVADDVGGGINGKHVDVYCGVGKAAEHETFRITTNAGRLCRS